MNNCLGRTNDRTIAMRGFRILKLAETPSFIMTIFWFSPLLTEHVVACEKNLVLFSDRHEMVASGTWRLTTGTSSKHNPGKTRFSSLWPSFLPSPISILKL